MQQFVHIIEPTIMKETKDLSGTPTSILPAICAGEGYRRGVWRPSAPLTPRPWHDGRRAYVEPLHWLGRR